MDLKLDESTHINKMKFNICFRWQRDDAYRAMNDSKLDTMAKELVMSLKPESITCEMIRDIHQNLAYQNEVLAIKELKKFMKEEFEGTRRYVRYVQEIIEYGVYCGVLLDPSRLLAFEESIHVTSEEFGVEVEFTIPEHCYIKGWGRQEYLDEMLSFRNCLADTLWEGPPGSVAVHESCAVVTYNVW